MARSPPRPVAAVSVAPGGSGDESQGHSEMRVSGFPVPEEAAERGGTRLRGVQAWGGGATCPGFPSAGLGRGEERVRSGKALVPLEELKKNQKTKKTTLSP